MSNIVSTGFITITDLSDPIISSTVPPMPVEDMLWLDISKTPPVLMIYKDGQWVAVSDTAALPDSAPIGGYFGGDLTLSSTMGQVNVTGGNFIHPNGTKYAITNDKVIYTNLKAKTGAIRFILFIGSDTSRFGFHTASNTSKQFVDAVYKDREWYYFVNDSVERKFEINSNDCIVAKLEEHDSRSNNVGIKRLVNYFENKDSVFEALTNGGEEQGIYKQDGLLFINAEYIKAGKLASVNGMSEFDLENGSLRVGRLTGNHLYFDGNNLSIKASSINIGTSSVATEDAVNDVVDNLSIGGRNLAQRTSSEYSNAFTDFTGAENETVYIGDVIVDDLVVGDTLTVRLVYEYTDIVPVEGKTAKAKMQGSGNVTEWNDGAFGQSYNLVISGSGEHEFLYSFVLTENHLRNASWATIIRHDYVQSGSVRWKMYKVEKGRKNTAWTPATEDVEFLISNTETLINDNIDKAITEASKEILDTVSKDYAASKDIDDFKQTVTANFQQTNGQINMQFETAQRYTAEVDGKLEEFQNNFATNIRFSEDGINLGKTNSPFSANLDNEKLAFKQGDTEIAYISNNKMYITQAHIKEDFKFGNTNGTFSWVIGESGNLSLKWSEA